MSTAKKRLLMADAAVIPMIPLLFLCNQNAKFLRFSQVAIVCLCLGAISIGLFLLYRFIFQSSTVSFIAILFQTIVLYAVNGIYSSLKPELAWLIFLLPIPIGFIVGYLCRRWFKQKEQEMLPLLASVFLAVMLALNLLPLLKNMNSADLAGAVKYKQSFTVNAAAPAPNVYWFLCDGMLGFDAMEQYFGDKQAGLTQELQERGFDIDRGAAFEAGHWTRIALPALMCPDYYDTYLGKILKDHEKANALREKTGTGLDNARVYNETINAFQARGYTTATISIDGPYFYPTTDYFYYIDARFRSPKDYVSVPQLVHNLKSGEATYDESSLYAHQLGEIFLGGIPGIIYDKLFPNSDIVEEKLQTGFSSAEEVLLNSPSGKINTALVTSLYDAIHSPALDAPKFVIVHSFLAHYPFDQDENGNPQANYSSILSYPGQHAYAGKVLIHMIDLILEADPDAVIVLQADHGLHMYTAEQIERVLGAGSATNIWNSVFSAIRVPAQYQTSDEQYALANPLNISRYIVNRFVGENYSYLTDSGLVEGAD